MILYVVVWFYIYISIPGYTSGASSEHVSLKKSLIWGPGLKADFFVPVRYFFIQLVSKDGSKLTDSVGENAITVTIEPISKNRARIWTQVLDRQDGSYVVRYRLYASTSDLQISVQVNGRHIASSPYQLKGDVYHDACNCPLQTADQWAASAGCPVGYAQIEHDLDPFKSIDMVQVAREAVEKFHHKGRRSICHYKVVSNQVYRKCYGEIVGFKMFADEILLSLARKMRLADFEFFVNLGDWPLENKANADKPIPIMSWCGSKHAYDIVLPTYDITEATLQMMGRITLDIFSIQANTGPKWENKSAVAFWRGRDSRRERLQLVEMSQNHPQLIDARLTKMFFFPHNETKYGQLTPQISFFEFFKYKYQLNIDGTVAAYRLPYLLAGDAAVFKQESEYYEHFYSRLKPHVHYVPIKPDLSDLLEKVQWARDNDDKVKVIAKNGQEFAREHLTPANILCYHVRVFQQYARRLKTKPQVTAEFELVKQPEESASCSCPSSRPQRTHGGEL